jgi:hypothetical protein
MNVIIVKSANSVARKITNRNTGTVTVFNEQTAAIECGEEFPRPFKLRLKDDQRPYPPGAYYIDPTSFRVNKYDSLEFGYDIALAPMPASAKAG